MEVRWRYARTLEITFDDSVGIGSYGFSETEFKKYLENPKKTLTEYNHITQHIHDMIIETLGDEVEIDWRSDIELEIHNFPRPEVEFAKKLQLYLDKAFKK